MEFWNEIYKKVSSTVSYTAKETGRYKDLTKVKFALVREKTRLEEAYKKLGEIYYNQLKNSDVDEKAVSLAYDTIEKSLIEIERLNAQVDIINNTKTCEGCGSKLSKDMDYCPKCGAKQAENEEQSTENSEE